MYVCAYVPRKEKKHIESEKNFFSYIHLSYPVMLVNVLYVAQHEIYVDEENHLSTSVRKTSLRFYVKEINLHTYVCVRTER